MKESAVSEKKAGGVSAQRAKKAASLTRDGRGAAEQPLMSIMHGAGCRDCGPSVQSLAGGMIQTPVAQRQAAAMSLQRAKGNRFVQGMTVQAKRGPNRTGMPDRLKEGIESLSGLDMSDVRVHYSSPKPAQLQALAYTQGMEVYVGPGQEGHLAHEAWHVVQQTEGKVRATTQIKGIEVNDEEEFEAEADRMGLKIMCEGAAMAAKKGNDALPVLRVRAVEMSAERRQVAQMTHRGEITVGEPQQKPEGDVKYLGRRQQIHIWWHKTRKQYVNANGQEVAGIRSRRLYAEGAGIHALKMAQPLQDRDLVKGSEFLSSNAQDPNPLSEQARQTANVIATAAASEHGGYPGNLKLTYGGTSGDASRPAKQQGAGGRKHDLMQVTFLKANQGQIGYTDSDKQILKGFIVRASSKLTDQGEAKIVMMNFRQFNGQEQIRQAFADAHVQGLRLEFQNNASLGRQRYDDAPEFRETPGMPFDWRHMKTDATGPVKAAGREDFVVGILRREPGGQ